MLISSSAIMEKLDEEFGTVYKPFSGFPDSGSLWNECIKTVNDATLMNHIIFNNDVMQIPPVKTFLKANKALTGGFTNYQKKALGAFWGFIFKSVFLYNSQKDNVPVGVKDIKKAARFTEPKSEVVVGELEEANGQVQAVPKYKLRLNLVEPKEDIVEPVSQEDVIEPSRREVAAEPVAREVAAEPVAREVDNEPIEREVAPERVEREVDNEPIEREVAPERVEREVDNEPIEREVAPERVEREAVNEPIKREVAPERVEREAVANPFDKDSVGEPDVNEEASRSNTVSPWNERMVSKEESDRN